MLLSSSNNNHFRVMDDFDQDWFEESAEDEVIKQHQSPLHVAVDPNFQPVGQINGPTGDFLELNVPVDENVFSAELAAAAQFQNLDPQPLQSVLDYQPSFNSQPPQTSKEEQQNNGQQEIEAGYTIETIGTVPPQTSAIDIEHNRDTKCLYTDCAPTTSYTVMQPPEPKAQEWTNSQCPGYDSNQQIDPQYPILCQNEFPMANTRIIVRDQSTLRTNLQSKCTAHSNHNRFVHDESHGIVHDYSLATNSSSNLIQTQDVPTSQHFIVTQEPHHHHLRLEECAQADAHGHISTFQQHFQPLPQPQIKRNHAPTKKSTKSRSKNKNNHNKSPMLPVSQCQESTISPQKSSEINLNQIANVLFTNSSNLATVQFDPQQNAEFSKILEETKHLKEQEEQGIDVGDRLKACEARIAQILIMSNSMSQPQFISPSTTLNNGAAKKQPTRSKPKKKPTNNMKTGQTQPASQMNATTSATFDEPPLSSSNLPPPTIFLPGTSIIVTDSTTFSSVLPSTTTSSSSMTPFPEVQNIDSASGCKAMIAQPKGKKQTKKSPHQIAQEKEAERIRQLKEKENRRIRLSNKFAELRASIPNLDYATPFADRRDCIKRLLPFGLYAEPELNNNLFEQYDGELQRHSDQMDARLKSAQDRFRSILFRESMCEMNEERNLLLNLDSEFERIRLQKAIGDHSFVASSFSGKTELEWEYDDGWDRGRFIHDAPFIPSPKTTSNENEEEMGGEISKETVKGMEEEERETCSLQPYDTLESDEPNSFVKISILPAKLASVRIPLQPYSVGSSQPDASPKPTNAALLVDDNEKSNVEVATNIQPSPAIETSQHAADVQTTSIQATKDEKPNTRPSIPPIPIITDATLIMDINQELVANAIRKMSEEVMNRLSSAPAEKRSEIIEEKEIITPQQQDFVEQKEESKPEAVKLKIKIGANQDQNGTFRSPSPEKGSEEKKDTKMDKKEKKRLKAERKAMKKLAKLERKDRKEEHKQSGSASTSKPPSLKISLSRLACWREAECSPGMEGMKRNGEGSSSTSQLTNGTTAKEEITRDIRENGGGERGLKLRISKLKLTNKPDDGDDDIKQEEGKVKKKRNTCDKMEETIIEGQNARIVSPSPVKIPRLLIRIGSSGTNTPKFEQKKREKPTVSSRDEPHQSEVQRVSTTNQGEPATDSFHPNQQLTSVRSSSNPVTDCRIQFSPCCSEESDDDELRNRTNELFSKLAEDQER